MRGECPLHIAHIWLSPPVTFVHAWRCTAQWCLPTAQRRRGNRRQYNGTSDRRRVALVRRRVGAPPVGVAAGADSTQWVLLRRHSLWRRHVSTVVATVLCQSARVAVAALWLERHSPLDAAPCHRVIGDGPSEFIRSAWSGRRWRRGRRLRRHWRRHSRYPRAWRRVKAVHCSLPIRHDRPRYLNGPTIQSSSDLVRRQMCNRNPVRHLSTSLRAVPRPKLANHCDPAFSQCR